MGNGLIDLKDIRIALEDLEVGKSERVDAALVIFDTSRGLPKHYHRGLLDIHRVSTLGYSAREMHPELYSLELITNGRWEMISSDNSERSPFRGKPYLQIEVTNFGVNSEARIYSNS